MRKLIFSLCLAAAALANQAEAHQYSFLLHNPIQLDGGPDEFGEVNFSVYLDPLKINWIAWSQAPSTNEDSDGISSVDPIVPNNYGIDDYMQIRLTSPAGKVSPTYELDRNDANNISYGPQAFIYGKAETNPRVVRTDAQGQPTFFEEGGVADEFVREGGQGYYNVSITFKNEFGDMRGTGDVYLLIDAREDFVPEAPSFQNRLGLDQLPYLNWGDHGSSGSYGRGGSGYFPGDGDGNDNGGGGGGGGNNPNIPSIPEIPVVPPPPDPDPGPDPDPVVPEPATLLLTALGLGGLAGRYARRKA